MKKKWYEEYPAFDAEDPRRGWHWDAKHGFLSYYYDGYVGCVLYISLYNLENGYTQDKAHSDAFRICCGGK